MKTVIIPVIASILVLGLFASVSFDDAFAKQGKVTICHKPGTPAEQTKEVPESAVPGHLGHGDTLGECGTNTPPTIESIKFMQNGNEVGIFTGTYFIIARDFPIECIADGVSDEDGDPVTLTYEWLRADGTSIIPEITLPASSPTGSTLPAIAPGTSDGDIVTCRVTPFDGIDFGASASELVCLHSLGNGFGGPCFS